MANSISGCHEVGQQLEAAGNTRELRRGIDPSRAVFPISLRSIYCKMVRCTRKGCGQEYDPSHNAEKSCSFHPGAPVRTPVSTLFPLVLTALSLCRSFTKGSSLGHAARM